MLSCVQAAISIIALLMGILPPSLSRARGLGRRTACMGPGEKHLSEIGDPGDKRLWTGLARDEI